MFFTKICVIPISVLFICGLTEQAALNNTDPFPLKLRPDSDIGPHELVYVGIVDGKTYYAEKDIHRTWEDAKKLCEGFNIKLKLATVKSRAQYDFLVKNGQEEMYWVGAHDKMGPLAFVWEGTDEHPVDYNVWYGYAKAYFCLTLRTQAESHGFQTSICSLVHPTICQLQTDN